MPVGTERSIVTGIDGSRSAGNAAIWASDEAAKRGLPLRLVHVFTIPVVKMPGWSPRSKGSVRVSRAAVGHGFPR
ncbi:universal stress protein [Amycolatopsis lurida]|uniref:universal stress protein n=1 Tax=Amycolatopsis lurida TaxID=31959 RepID=UPI0031346531